MNIKKNKRVVLKPRKIDATQSDKEREQQQQFFNKRKLKELKKEQHQELMAEQKREKIMKKLNNQAKQDLLKQKAKEQGLYSLTELDKELMQSFKYNKLNWKKFFLIYFNNPEHQLKPIKVKGLWTLRYKKEDYLSKKDEFIVWLKNRLRKDFNKVAKRFNYTMERYVKKYNDIRFKKYKIKLRENKPILKLK